MTPRNPRRKPSDLSADSIDLNADVGELGERLADGREAALIRQLSSANIACGGHAGDRRSMQAVVALCREAGVAVGAHPSYPDREGFGRRQLPIEPAALIDSLGQQLQALADIARQQGVALAHVKPHGALYHAVADQPAVAEALVEALFRLGIPLSVVGRAGSRGLAIVRRAGLPTLAEGFADRRYAAAGTLVERSQPGAVLQQAEAICGQALRLIRERSVQASDGSDLVFDDPIDTLCLHSDTPSAEALAAQLRQRLEGLGIAVRPPPALHRAPATLHGPRR